MNWSMREKMLTYFYKKFRPVSRMHFKKSGENLIPHIFLVAAEGLWHFGSLINHNTHYSQESV